MSRSDNWTDPTRILSLLPLPCAHSATSPPVNGVAPICRHEAGKVAPENLEIGGFDVLVADPPKARNQNFARVRIQTDEPGTSGRDDAT